MSSNSRQQPSLAAATEFAGGTDPFMDDGEDLPARYDHVGNLPISSPRDDSFPSDASFDADSTHASPALHSGSSKTNGLGINSHSDSLRPPRHRFSQFDIDAFSLTTGSSPEQAKRALEAHLAETERRLQETAHLGQQLVEQRTAVETELERIQDWDGAVQITPALRQKLNDLEKEYNDVVKETARAFLPKQRVVSTERDQGGNTSPFVNEPRGRRSISPSKFESMAANSPTKLTVPSNRRLRNQPANRVKDIEFAAEISTSLLRQVRDLQNLLEERESEVRDLNEANAKLEQESESLMQRLKTSDESETRFREENWNLETRVFELENKEKESLSKIERLNQSLAVVTAEKNATQRELDEVKVVHAKLVEDHASEAKAHDIELGTAKRTIATAELESSNMRRKIEELTRQNSELAKAITVARGRTLERSDDNDDSDDDMALVAESATPEHSPPPSPVKNTPRHAMLESETLKTSLLHAQRTIQSQRTQLHREKTEKLEMRRIVQDLRDELEKLREDPTNGATNVTVRKSKKNETSSSRDYYRKPSSNRLLGAHRTTREEVIMDNDWEDANLDDEEDEEIVERSKPSTSRRLFGTPSPSTSRTRARVSPAPSTGTVTADNAHRSLSNFRRSAIRVPIDADVPLPSIESDNNDTSDCFETADEAQDDETEDGRDDSDPAMLLARGELDEGYLNSATDTDGAFHTGAEDLSSEDSDVLTETESPSKGAAERRRPRALQPRSSRRSFSHDIDGFSSPTSPLSPTMDVEATLRTPSLPASRARMQALQRGYRSRTVSEEPNFMSSPASYVTNSSTNGTPQHGVGHVSLFAELQDLQSEGDSSFMETPSRQGTMSPSSLYHQSVSPQQQQQLNMLSMSGGKAPFDPERGRMLAIPNSMRRMLMVDAGMNTDEIESDDEVPLLSLVTFDSIVDYEPVALMAPRPPILVVKNVEERGDSPVKQLGPAAPILEVKQGLGELEEVPVAVPKAVVVLPEISRVSLEHVHRDVHTEPAVVVKEKIVRPELSISAAFQALHEEPVVVPREKIVPPELSISTAFEALHEEPVMLTREKVVKPVLSMSSASEVHHEPEVVPKVRALRPTLAMFTHHHEHQEPVLETKVKVPKPTLMVSDLVEEHYGPVAVPKEKPILPELSVSGLLVEEREPIVVAAPVVDPPRLSASFFEDLNDSPINMPKKRVPIPSLDISMLTALVSEQPVEVRKASYPPSRLSVSSVYQNEQEPAHVRRASRPLSMVSVSEYGDEPIKVASGLWPSLNLSGVQALQHEPVHFSRPLNTPKGLTFSGVSGVSQAPERRSRVVSSALSVSSMEAREAKPFAPRVGIAISPELSISGVRATDAEPVVEQTQRSSSRLSFVWKGAYDDEPVAAKSVGPTPELSITPAGDLHMAPRRARAPVPRALALSSLFDATVQPSPGPSNRSSMASNVNLGLSQVSQTHLAPAKGVAAPMYSPIGMSASELQDIFPAPPPSRPAPFFGTSSVVSESMEPFSGSPESSRPPSLWFSGVSQQSFEPVRAVSPPPLEYSKVTHEVVAASPVSAPTMSFGTLYNPKLRTNNQMSYANVSVSPRKESFASNGSLRGKPNPARLSVSEMTAVVDLTPQALSPKRAGFVMPLDVENPFAGLTGDDGQRFAALFGRGGQRSAGTSTSRLVDDDRELVIAEDDTRQSIDETPEPATPESQRPLKEVAGNTIRSARSFNSPVKPKAVMVDSSVQTTVSSDMIDDWMSTQFHVVRRSYDDVDSIGGQYDSPLPGMNSPQFSGMHSMPASSPTHVPAVRRARQSSTSIRQSLEDARRARERDTHMSGSTRPRTPGSSVPPSIGRGGSSRYSHGPSGETPSKNTVHSQQSRSSVSSFSSEVDQRFDMTRGLFGMESGRQVDPRMMLAVTEVMIGEFVWKYTRRAGRNGDTHGTRRRRYFWIHPYMRMLFWCDENPMLSRKGEVVCKASRIEAVRVATDDNPLPPGLHRKSMMLMTADGTVKFTCQTGQRHETWFNALSYLLHRGGSSTNNGVGYAEGDSAGNIMRVAEEGTTEGWREEEHVAAYSTDPVTARLASRNPHGLLPHQIAEQNGGAVSVSPAPGLPSTGTIEKEKALKSKRSIQTISDRLGNAFTSLRTRASAGNMQGSHTHSHSHGHQSPHSQTSHISIRKKRSFMSSRRDESVFEAHDSAEDLRVVLERQEAESGRVENVRACCDGRHDVGTLRGGRWGSRGDLKRDH